MKKFLIKHIAIQAVFVLFYFFNEVVVKCLNMVLRFIGLNPYDSHISLGVYIYFLLTIIFSFLYLALTVIFDKKKFSKKAPMWIIRFEIICLMSLGLIYFMYY